MDASTTATPGAGCEQRSWARAGGALALRPGLWPTALRQASRMTRPGWWRRPPFLWRPDGGYVRFRTETQYGAGGAPRPLDLVIYLAWCRDQERARRRGPRAGHQ